jgi:hypothetical protein
MEDKKKIDELEHKLLKKDIDSISFEMHAGFGAISKALEKGFELIRAENAAQNKASIAQREEIIKKQDLTNGRVTALEKVTSSLKYLQDHKKVALLIFWGAYNAYDWASIRNGIEIYKWISSLI